MPFESFASIEISQAWQVTEPTEANFFRLRYQGNQGFSYLVIAQAQMGADGLELFESRRFPVRGEIDVLRSDIPPVFDPVARRLAVRGVAPKSAKTPNLTLIIEASQMIVLNPTSGQTSQLKETIFKQDAQATTAIDIAANSSRNGGVIFNRGNKRLFVGLGFTADAGSPFALNPGGQMPIENGFTGRISLLFQAVDPDQVTNKTLALVEEFVA
jgi:hypothetical protein